MKFKFLVPSVFFRPFYDKRKGVCLLYDKVEDVDALRCGWFYDYAVTTKYLGDPRYVPMSWGGNDVNLPVNYAGYLIVLNEPNNDKQGNLTPMQAVRRISFLSSKFPKAKLIVGGPSYHGEQWLIQFAECIKPYKPYGWHFHAYTEWDISGVDVAEFFTRAREICPEGEFWVTEIGDANGGKYINSLLNFVKTTSWITRFSWFCNRLEKREWYIPDHWEIPSLLNWDGSEREFGKIYKKL